MIIFKFKISPLYIRESTIQLDHIYLFHVQIVLFLLFNF
nr:MAG TPA_asm: hypothetical protein [Caudoviricetes sp.]